MEVVRLVKDREDWRTEIRCLCGTVVSAGMDDLEKYVFHCAPVLSGLSSWSGDYIRCKEKCPGCGVDLKMYEPLELPFRFTCEALGGKPLPTVTQYTPDYETWCKSQGITPEQPCATS